MARMTRMTLRRRFVVYNLLLVGGILIFGGVTVWRLVELTARVNIAQSIYAEVRAVGVIAGDLGTVDGLLSDPRANRDPIVEHLNYAIGGLDQFIHVNQGYGSASGAELARAYLPINETAARARGRLQQSLDDFRAQDWATRIDAKAQRAAIQASRQEIDRIDSSCIQIISGRQQAASKSLASSLVIIGVLAAAAVVAALLLGVLQHRSILLPLQRLRRSVRDVAAAQFSQNLEPLVLGNSPEFADLAGDFNNMARELDGFYHRLEAQVREKSRELVRSERLASVGFLAAGVAHEINNPLNIISGYAEIVGKKLEAERGPIDQQTIEQARDSLRIIREETFRCKQITENLLSLSRNGSEDRETLDLGVVARDVASMTGGLKPYRDRRLTLKLNPAEPLEVRANLTEMKQVLLNLTINALESTPPVGGEVCIEGRRSNGWVEVCVRDNGRGMAPEVLRHVFEPFFTARGAHTERGTGLGLSITHAIVESHRGRIDAESDGPGRGATFTVRIPAGEEF